MLIYLKYFALWLLFMGLIAVITLLVPKIAKAMEKKIAKIKEETKGKKALGDLSDEIMPEDLSEKAETKQDNI